MATFYSTIYKWTLVALNTTGTATPYSKVKLYIDSTIRNLLDTYPCIGDEYADLTGNDKLNFDEAAGLLVALRARPNLPKSEALGELVEVKLGQKGFKWAKATAEEPWEPRTLRAASSALKRVTCIGAIYALAATEFQPFKVSGPTRNRTVTLGRTETLMTGLISLLTDDYAVETDS